MSNYIVNLVGNLTCTAPYGVDPPETLDGQMILDTTTGTIQSLSYGLYNLANPVNPHFQLAYKDKRAAVFIAHGLAVSKVNPK